MTAAPRSAGSQPWLRASNIPNLICIVRILLVWPIVIALLDARHVTALLLIVAAGISDGLDGFLAKRYDWRSRLGGLLDPIADKLLIVSTFVALTWLELVPLWLTVSVILRDVVILTGGAAYQAFIGAVQPQPSGVSKINTGAQLVFLLGVVSQQAVGLVPAQFLIAAGACAFVTSVVSGLDYVVRWTGKAVRARR